MKLIKIQAAEAIWGRDRGNRWKHMCLEGALFHLEKGSLPLPTIREFAWILQRCRKERSGSHALRLYDYMRKNGLEAHPSIGNYLVPLLTEFGNILDARNVFDKMLIRNEWSWSALICSYTKLGEPQESLHLYRGMREDHSLYPLGHTYVSLLKACVQLKDLESGIDIHGEVARNGLLERDPFMGSSLVDMYAKCGSVPKAQEVFDGLQVWDLVTWTALMAGYCENEQFEEALLCYEKMQLNGVLPDAATIVCALKACSGMRSLSSRAQEIHTEIERQGWVEKSLLVGNALIDFYAKSGFFSKARHVLDEIPFPDVISWTSLMYGYSEHGHDDKAIGCFEQMQREGILPNAVTFICLLKACGGVRSIEKGQEIHTEIVKLGSMETDAGIGNTLVDMYAKCGWLAAAHHVCDGLPIRNVVSWAALVQGYVEAELAEEALQCFKHMQFEGILPDALSFIGGLKACGTLGAIEKGEELHDRIKTRRFSEGDDVLGNALIDMYVKCGSLLKAQQVFDELETRDVTSWTVIITGYTQHEAVEQALRYFEQMQLEGIYPNPVTLVCISKACGSIRDTARGKRLHVYIERHGLVEKDVRVGNALVDMYAKCGLLSMARHVFDRLPKHTLVSWSALISAHAAHEQPEEAIRCFGQMRLKSISPDAITIACFLRACGSIGALDKVEEIRAEVGSDADLDMDMDMVGNALVYAYAKCGLLPRARQVFEGLPVQDVVSWTALMAGYARVGEIGNVCHLFEHMLENGVKPDPITFIVVLGACARGGLFRSTQTYYELMSKDCGLTPSFQHNICIIDLFLRSGRVDQALDMTRKMAVGWNSAAWNCMLRACRSWGNSEFARKVFALGEIGAI